MRISVSDATASWGSGSVRVGIVRLRVRSLFCAVTCAAAFVTTASYASTFAMEVDVDQRVTMSGRSPSLRTVVEDLCWRAGVELRAFDADDRGTAVDLSGVPLGVALERLFTEESYMIGMAERDAGKARVAWLQVLGPTARARARRSGATVGRKRRNFEIPPDLLRAAFGGTSDDAQAKALDQIRHRIVADSSQRAGFLATDAKLIAETLARYPAARPLLEKLVADETDESLKKKVAAVLGEM